MLEYHKKWFLDNIQDKVFKKTVVSKPRVERKYEYFNFTRSQVPFDSEFSDFLIDYVGDSDFTYELYHIHKWYAGSFFDTHYDRNANRKFGYVCELSASDCCTKLLVEDTPVTEAVFDCDTLHRVPVIKEGLRISLTVFGVNTDKHKTMI
jgi:hypothetical protein